MDSEQENRSIEDYQQAVSTILSVSSGKRENIVYAIYCQILEAPQEIRRSLLQYVADLYDDVQSSETVPAPAFITEQERDHYATQYGKIIDAMLDSLVKENLDEEAFYEKLWNMINNPLFDDEKVRAFALYWVLIDSKIPYFKIEQGLKMADEDYKMLQLRIRRSIKKLHFILALGFTQRTEKADVVLSHLLDHPTREEKAVLISHIIAHGERIAELARRSANA